MKSIPMNTLLRSLVEERIREDEVVFSWEEVGPGEVEVRLISAQLLRLTLGTRLGRRGRSLIFRERDGAWLPTKDHEGGRTV